AATTSDQSSPRDDELRELAKSGPAPAEEKTSDSRASETAVTAAPPPPQAPAAQPKDKKEADGDSAVANNRAKKTTTDDRAEPPARAESEYVSRDQAGSGGAARPASPRRSTRSIRGETAARGRTAPVDGADESREDAESKKKDNESETRVVAGRRFRRQDGRWVDTAYRAPQATVNVARGSEQFRALVADEPELRRVAEQLGGEVIVVWRGRAYRIR
ncbi:MAG: hypothetical protein ACRD68_02400, partial [Pyrinomonadaceae bacterium]